MGGGGGMGVIQSSAPISPKAGSLWSDTDSNLLYRRSDDDTAWSNVSSQKKQISTAATFNPNLQTGIIDLAIDSTNLTFGQILVKVDGSTKQTITQSTTAKLNQRIYKPSSSLSLVSSFTAGFSNNKEFEYGSSQVPAGTLASVTVGDSGTKMYLSSNSASDNQSTYQYTLSTAYDVSTASYASKSFEDPVSADIRGMNWKSDGSRWARCSDQSGNKKFYDFTTSSNWDISTSSSATNFDYSSYQTGGKDVVYGDSGDQVTSLSDNATLNTYDLSTAYQVSSASNTSKDEDLSSIDNAPRSHAWNTNGTKCFYLGAQNDKIYQLDCSTAWDITSMSHDSGNDIDVSGETGVPYGLAIKEEVSPSIFYVGSTASPYKVFQYSENSFSGSANVDIS